mmetsp:Transcript_40398/g.121720  ORF Transcript_40398/g.121720 Transcript_40398/m.121720 type:complete len:370 (+) Transcript_40398:450-1559(+)
MRHPPIPHTNAPSTEKQTALDLVQDLPLTLSSLQVQMSLGRLIQWEGCVNRHIQLALLQPTENFVRPSDQLLPRGDVIQQFRPGNVRRLSDEAEDGEGGNRPRRVPEGDEDAPVSQGVDGDVHRGLADAVDDALDALPVGNFHDLRHDVHRIVVLVGRAGDFVQNEELVAPEGLSDVLLPLGAGPNDLVSPQLGHLRGPLARPPGDAVDEAPLPGLDEVGVGGGGEVVGREALDDARGGDVEADAVGDRQELGGGDGGVLGVRPEDGVRHLVPHLDALGGGLVTDGGDDAPALLPADEGQVARVHPLAVVRVDEIDAGELVLHNDLPRFEGRTGEVRLNLERVGITDFADDGRLHGGRHRRHASSSEYK